MLSFDILAAGQIGNGACYFDGAQVGPGREIKLSAGSIDERLGRRGQPAILLQLLICHGGVQPASSLAVSLYSMSGGN